MKYTLDDLTDVPSGIYDRLKQKFVNFNKPDTEFADLPYEAQTASIERRQKLADLLQQQARSPIEIQSYKGIQAPIATTAGLSKVLDSIMAGYEEGDTATQAKEAAKAQEADTKYTLDEVDKATNPAYRTTAVTRSSLPDIPGAKTSTGPMTALPPGTSAPSVPNYDAQSEAEAESAGTTVGNLPQPAGYDPQAALANIPSAFAARPALDNGYTGLSGQSLQQGSHQDLVKALLHSKVTALRNAGLTMATTPEKRYMLAEGANLVGDEGVVYAQGQKKPGTPPTYTYKEYKLPNGQVVTAGFSNAGGGGTYSDSTGPHALPDKAVPYQPPEQVNPTGTYTEKNKKVPFYTDTQNSPLYMTADEANAFTKAGHNALPISVDPVTGKIAATMINPLRHQQTPSPGGWGTATAMPQSGN